MSSNPFEENPKVKKARVKESTVQKNILKRLRSLGGKWWVNHGDMYSEAGQSDIEGCYLGRHISIEVKVPGDDSSKATKAQLKYIEEIRAAGGIAGVARTPDEAEAMLTGLPKP